jgi:hypothetical protein
LSPISEEVVRGLADTIMAPAVISKPTFTVAQRIVVQQEAIREKNYNVLGRLLSVVFEGPRNIAGLSQSRPRYANANQAANMSDPTKPFSEMQAKLFASITLDFLSWHNAPAIALSRDKKDLLLPQGLGELPAIPDPRWTADHAFAACPNSKDGCKGCLAPRIPQLLTGCPVVGDRVQNKITARDGHTYGVISPVNQLILFMLSGQGHFFQIKGHADSDGSHLTLLIDDDMRGYFVGGRFSFGG